MVERAQRKGGELLAGQRHSCSLLGLRTAFWPAPLFPFLESHVPGGNGLKEGSLSRIVGTCQYNVIRKLELLLQKLLEITDFHFADHCTWLPPLPDRSAGLS